MTLRLPNVWNYRLKYNVSYDVKQFFYNDNSNEHRSNRVFAQFASGTAQSCSQETLASKGLLSNSLGKPRYALFTVDLICE